MLISKEEIQPIKLQQVKVKGDTMPPFNGWFHAWGQRAYVNDNGSAFNITVAIVETEKGEIRMCDPDYITFLR